MFTNWMIHGSSLDATLISSWDYFLGSFDQGGGVFLISFQEVDIDVLIALWRVLKQLSDGWYNMGIRLASD